MSHVAPSVIRTRDVAARARHADADVESELRRTTIAAAPVRAPQEVIA